MANQEKPCGQRRRHAQRGRRSVRDLVRVAAFGDWAMWGQGLRRQDRYTALLLQMLPAIYGDASGARLGLVAIRSTDIRRSEYAEDISGSVSDPFPQ
jgi:hypothetical protein